MTQSDNPYVVPLSNASYPIPQTSRSSKVMLGAFVGAILGVGFWAVVLMMVVAKPIPLAPFDARNFLLSQSPDLFAMIFWAFVIGTCFAILGSIVGALVDTFYSAEQRLADQRLTYQSDPSDILARNVK